MIHDHPACYGLPVAVSASSPSCCACPSRVGCAGVAFSFLETLPDDPVTQRERQSLSLTRKALTDVPQVRFGQMGIPMVVATSRGVKRLVLSEATLDEISRLPARVASQVRKLSACGWFDFAKVELRAGRNPASKGWKKVFCDLLLAGGCARSALELALVEKMDLTLASARVQVSVGVSIFAAGRLATFQLGRFEVSPN